MNKNLVFILVALASLGCRATVGTMELAWGETPSANEVDLVKARSTSAPLATPPATAAVATVVTAREMIVCTGVPGGHLNIRVSPGATAVATAYASEESVVIVTGRIVERDDGRWAEISSPVPGWVNAKYICGVVP